MDMPAHKQAISPLAVSEERRSFNDVETLLVRACPSGHTFELFTRLSPFQVFAYTIGYCSTRIEVEDRNDSNDGKWECITAQTGRYKQGKDHRGYRAEDCTP